MALVTEQTDAVTKTVLCSKENIQAKINESHYLEFNLLKQTKITLP